MTAFFQLGTSEMEDSSYGDDGNEEEDELKVEHSTGAIVLNSNRIVIRIRKLIMMKYRYVMFCMSYPTTLPAGQ